MAPEVLDARISLQDIQAFKQIDIYSLSLVMWEVAWRCNVQQGDLDSTVEPLIMNSPNSENPSIMNLFLCTLYRIEKCSK